MEEERLQRLLEKREGSGLTHDEADELGRLMADEEGRSYGGAQAQAIAADKEDRADEEARREKAPSPFEIVESERETEIEER
jgi:hypothetical protein